MGSFWVPTGKAKKCKIGLENNPKINLFTNDATLAVDPPPYSHYFPPPPKLMVTFWQPYPTKLRHLRIAP